MNRRSAGEAGEALSALVRDSDALDDVTRAVRSGSDRDDPLDAVRDVAEQGNRGLWDAWTKAEASSTILTRAMRVHRESPGYREMQAAQSGARRAAAAIEDWIVDGALVVFVDVERVARRHLDRAAEMARAALAEI